MQNKIFAVIDTNVLVSALISKTLESNPAKIIRAIVEEKIIPVFNNEILSEYYDVLTRSKFNIDVNLVNNVINAFIEDGLSVDRTTAHNIDFPDPKDIVFYEVSLSIDDSYLITGNIKHFPISPKVVTPKEFIDTIYKATELIKE